MIKNKKILFILIILLLLPQHVFSAEKYPKIGLMGWGGGTPEWYARFDFLHLEYHKSADFLNKIRNINPDVIILPTGDWNLGNALSIPDEWYVKTSAGEKIPIYGGHGYLINISDLCPEVDGKKYNDRLIEQLISGEFVDLNLWDGIATDGVWESPRGSDDFDLDQNGVNDLEEHDAYWLRSHWMAGVDKVLSGVRKGIGDKILFLNSGRFHGFGWEETNGMYFEHAKFAYAMRHYKNTFDNWLKTNVPEPRIILYGANRMSTKESFSEMRFHLGLALYGEGVYFEATDGVSNEHDYVSYYDEFDLNLGEPLNKMQMLRRAPGRDGVWDDKGVWVRFFKNGVVILNVENNPNTVTDEDLKKFSDYNGPYYRFLGGQDPEFNNGGLFELVELTGRSTYDGGFLGDAIFLLKESMAIVADIWVDVGYDATSPASNPAEMVGAWENSNDRNAGAWSTGSGSGKHSGNFSLAQESSSSTYATFRPTIGVAGNYEIFEWHPTNTGKKLATNVKYELKHAGGTENNTINQSQNGGQWNSLGTFFLNKGTDNYVKLLTQDADGFVAADAIKLVYQGAENIFDFNLDNKVDVQDFGLLLSNWSKRQNLFFNTKNLDTNEDGKIDAVDVGGLLSCWGEPMQNERPQCFR